VNDADWTFDLALKALTEGDFDLHTPTTPTNGWITFDPNYDKSKGSDIWFEGAVGLKYHTYYAAKVNTDAQTAWTTAVGNINTAMAEIGGGNYGTMNVVSLNEFMHMVNTLDSWLKDRSGEFHKFNEDLNSKDSGFKGTAAFVISDRLKHIGDALADLDQQMTTKNGVGVPAAAAGAQSALHDYGVRMANTWYGVVNYLSDFPRAHVNWWQDRIDNYVNTPGLFTGGGFHTSKYYQDRLAQFPMPDGTRGDLGSKPTWDAMNLDITTRLKAEIKTYLDGPAADIMGKLRTAYEGSASAIVPLVAPTVLPTVLPQDDKNGNNPPPDTNTPPPPLNDSGNTPPPGGDPNTNTPPPGGPDLANTPPPGGLPNLTSTPPPGGPDLANTPPPGGLPNLTNTPPPGDPANTGNSRFPNVSPFISPPLPKGPNSTNQPLPKGPSFTNQPLSKGPNFANQPVPKGLDGGLPGAAGGGPVDQARSSSGLHIPALKVPPGSPVAGVPGADPSAAGANTGGLGANTGGLGANTGGLGANTGGLRANTSGLGANTSGLDGTGGLPGSALTGTPGGTPGDGQNNGGVPFFPPMMGGMGGMGGAGEKPQERERQTWLAEDESVWGTDVAAGSGVIGRLEDEEGSEEILIASLPGQERLHPAIHRRRRRTEESEKRSAAHAGELPGAEAQEPPQTGQWPGAHAQERPGPQERPAESAAPATT